MLSENLNKLNSYYSRNAMKILLPEMTLEKQAGYLSDKVVEKREFAASWAPNQAASSIIRMSLNRQKKPSSRRMSP